MGIHLGALIDRLKLYPQDKANHYGYGSLVAATAAPLTIAVIAGVCVLLHRGPPLWLFTAGAAAAVLSACLAGKLVERLQAKANAAAVAAGQPEPHEVSVADVQATTWGALPVAWTLLVLQALALWLALGAR